MADKIFICRMYGGGMGGYGDANNDIESSRWRIFSAGVFVFFDVIELI